jgi:hypothetical protein
MTGARLLELARHAQVEAIFLKVRRDGSRTECWIRRESLGRWIAGRDAELVPYMARPEAKETLGLTNTTIVAVATAGVIRYVKGPDRGFPARCFFFLREDVMRIKDAFEKHSLPVTEYSKPGELIELRHAVKNYLGHGEGLAAVIRAVVDGALVPTGCTTPCRGIIGYLFRSEDLRKYRLVPDVAAPREGFLNYREAAALLEVRTDVIRGLAAQGILTAAAGFRNGFARLIPAREVQKFAEQYVSTSILARRFDLNSGSLASYLRASDAPLLAIPLPDAGRGHACFIRKDVAADIKFPKQHDAAGGSATTHRGPEQEVGEYRQANGRALDRPRADFAKKNRERSRTG